MTSEPPNGPHYSPDGQWWWTGSQWVPAAPVTPYGAPPSYGYAQGPSYPVIDQGTNGLAIASLVLGIIWLSGLGSLLAVIFGHIAHGQIKRTGQRGRGLATAGLILGYLGLVATAVSVVLLVAFGVNAAHSVRRDAQVRTDLRAVAEAEESYDTVHQSYTSDLGQLAVSLPNTDTVVIGVNGSAGYCVIGSDDSTSFPRIWSLYDSENGGLGGIYSSQLDAEKGCSDPRITQFGSLTGAGT